MVRGRSHHKRQFSDPPGPVGVVLRCTHPNAICIPNRTDRLESR